MSVALNSLNPQQREAVTTTTGPLLVLAGAGSGKTRVITFRVAHLIRGCGVEPGRICALSFTNKAAGEMRERVTALLPGVRKSRGPVMSTFHSLCVRILRKSGHHIGLPERFVIYDTADQIGVIKTLMRDLKIDDREFDPFRVLGLISDAKNRLEDPDRFTMRYGDDYDLMAAQIYPGYQQSLRAFGAVDFDDLIMQVVHIFRSYPSELGLWQRAFSHLMIDEYQDTNRAQFELARLLSAEHRNICVVGDDDQSIYGWRGADVDNILGFDRKFTGAKVVTLEQNYRSTNTILRAANAVIQNNRVRRQKTLWSALGDGEPIDMLVCEDDIEESKKIVARMLDLKHRLNVHYEQMAVLFRTNAQSRVVETELRARGIPYVLVGGKKFFDRKEVKDLVSYMRAVLIPSDEVALRRIINYPPRGIGRTTIENVMAHGKCTGLPFHKALDAAAEDPAVAGSARGAAALQAFIDARQRWQRSLTAVPGNGRLSGGLRSLVKEIGLVEAVRDEGKKASAARVQIRLDNIEELLRAVADYEDLPPDPDAEGGPPQDADHSLMGFLRDNALDNDLSRDKDKEQDQRGVTLMTLHSAKGLEFPYVFMVGMEEGLLPHQRPNQEIADLDEERRLCYVGITRAQRKLVMSRATTRRKYGRDEDRTPSRFIAELPENLLKTYDYTSPGPSDEAEQDDADVGRSYIQSFLASLEKK